jgi:hypothetical protein
LLRIALSLLTLVLAAESPAERRMRADTTFLAEPRMEGRGNGSPRLDEAAAFVARRYRKLGLRPVVQRYPFMARVLRVTQDAALAGRPLAWGTDVEAVCYSADAALQGATLTFVGCGLKGSANDDVREVQGKVAVILRKVPDAQVLAHLPRLEKSLLMRIQKLEAAGAAAVIVAEEEDQPHRLVREEGPAKVGLPVVSMPARALAALGDLPALSRAIAETGQPQQVPDLPGAFDLRLTLKREEAQLPNVVAVIRGRDPKLRNEYIAVGGHLDHLGMGERHSMAGAAGLGHAHPGADDNASGTAMVLELARTFQAHPPRRSILLLNFSGEEEGLLGSAYWVGHPTMPLASVKFMVNLDMVGRLDPVKPSLFLGGLGAQKAAVDRAVAKAPQGMAVGADMGASVGGSDHMSFASAKVPTFFFFTGLHGDYHRPTDTAARLNFAGMATVAKMVEQVVQELADGQGTPIFDPETAKLPAAKGDSGPMRIAFGTIPDYTENPKGFRINGTSAGGTAEAIGMKAGDILVQFGTVGIRTIYDFMGALGAYKPGDKAVVKWLRDGVAMEAEATLKGR